MVFFNEVWADKIQYLTLPLEVVGLMLAFIEIFRPPLADRIESAMDQAGLRLNYQVSYPIYMIILIFPLFLIFTFNDVIRKKTSKDTAFESLKNSLSLQLIQLGC